MHFSRLIKHFERVSREFSKWAHRKSKDFPTKSQLQSIWSGIIKK